MEEWLRELSFGTLALRLCLDDVLRYLKNNGIMITNLKIHTREGAAAEKYIAEVHLRGSGKGEETITAHVVQMPGIVSATVL